MSHRNLLFLLTTAIVLIVVPIASLVFFGYRHLHQQGFLLHALLVSGVCLSLGFLCLHCLVKKMRPFRRPDPTIWDFPPEEHDAWPVISEIADRAVEEFDVHTIGERILPTTLEVFQAVARTYDPDGENPEQDVTIADACRLVSLVARDLERFLAESIPGSHILTISHLIRFSHHRGLAGSLYRWYNRAGQLYRPLQAFWNPAGAVSSQVRRYYTQKLGKTAGDQAIRFVIYRLGYYAIKTYSGQIALEAISTGQAYTTGANSEANTLSPSNDSETANDIPPVRILLLGQANAGKSSLANQLFGTDVAPTDCVPCTEAVTPYSLQHDELQAVTLFDTVGYGTATGEQAMRQIIRQWPDRCDFLLMVCSATDAARQADRQWLDAFRAHYAQAAPHKQAPPVLVVLNKIDLLRPMREWEPPYNLVKAKRAKEQSIRDAVLYTAESLDVPVDQVIPVCLAPERTYNVTDLLLPLMIKHMPEAARVRLERTVEAIRKKNRSLSTLSIQLGKLAMQTGRYLVRETLR